MKVPPTLSIRDYDYIRACQYAYYCLSISLVTDYEYDMIVKEYERETGNEVPMGSDNRESYNDYQWYLAHYFIKRRLLD